MDYPIVIDTEATSVKTRVRCSFCDVRFHPTDYMFYKAFAFAGGWLYCWQCFSTLGEAAQREWCDGLERQKEAMGFCAKFLRT